MATGRKTTADIKFKKYADDHARIDRAQRYADTTGVCPVCYVRPRGHGITCGTLECIGKWLHIEIGGVEAPPT